MNRASIVSGVALVLVFAGVAPSFANELTDAIRQRAEAYVAAYNQHDAHALAGLWADDAVYVNRDTGEAVEGRAAIEQMFTEMFASGEASELSVTIHAVRPVTDGVAIEDGTADLVSADGGTTSSTYTAIHVKKDGAWYLNSVRETDMPTAPADEHGELEELAWLVGDWVDDSPDATIKTSWQWAKNGRFLTGAFALSVDGSVEIEGTQVIGWNAAAGQFRSWVFDTEGGVAEGVWERIGNQWVIRSTSTLADGSQGSATNIYRLVDEDTLAFSSVDREIDGEPEPDVEEVLVHRQFEETPAALATADAEQGGK